MKILSDTGGERARRALRYLPPLIFCLSACLPVSDGQNTNSTPVTANHSSSSTEVLQHQSSQQQNISSETGDELKTNSTAFDPGGNTAKVIDGAPQQGQIGETGSEAENESDALQWVGSGNIGNTDKKNSDTSQEIGSDEAGSEGEKGINTSQEEGSGETRNKAEKEDDTLQEVGSGETRSGREKSEITKKRESDGRKSDTGSGDKQSQEEKNDNETLEESNAEAEGDDYDANGETESESEGLGEPETTDEASVSTLMTFYTILLLVILGGNFWVILTFSLRGETLMKQSPYLYVMSLACADFCIGVFVITGAMAALYSEYWLNRFLCKACQYFAHLAVTASVMSLTAIAADRYITMRSTTIYHATLSTTKKIIIAIWLCTSIYSLRIPFVFDMVNKPVQPSTDGDNGRSITMCAADPGNGTLFRMMVMADFIISFLIPFCCIAVFYSFIIGKLSSATPAEPAAVITNNGATNNGKLADSRNSNKLSAHRQKILIKRLLIILVIMFFILHLPLQVLKLQVYFFDNIFENVIVAIQTAEIIMFFNSCFNVFVYVIFMPHLRTAMNSIMKCTNMRRVHPSSQ